MERLIRIEEIFSKSKVDSFSVNANDLVMIKEMSDEILGLKQIIDNQKNQIIMLEKLIKDDHL